MNPKMEKGELTFCDKCNELKHSNATSVSISKTDILNLYRWQKQLIKVVEKLENLVCSEESNEKLLVKEKSISTDLVLWYKGVFKKGKDKQRQKLSYQKNALEAKFKIKCEKVAALINRIKSTLTQEDLSVVDADYEQVLGQIETLKLKIHQWSQKNEILENKNEIFKADPEAILESEQCFVQEISNSSKENREISDSTFNTELNCLYEELLSKKEKDIEGSKQDNQKLVDKKSFLEAKCKCKCEEVYALRNRVSLLIQELEEVKEGYQKALVQIETLNLKRHQSEVNNKIMENKKDVFEKIAEDFTKTEQFFIQKIPSNCSNENATIKDCKFLTEGYHLNEELLLKKEEYAECSKQDNQKLVDHKIFLEEKFKSKCEEIYALNERVNILTQELAEVRNDHQQALVDNEILKLKVHKLNPRNEILYYNKENLKNIPEDVFETEQFLAQDSPNYSSNESMVISNSKQDFWYKELLEMENYLECCKQDNQKLVDQNRFLEAQFKYNCEEVYSLNERVNILTQELAEVNNNYQQALVEIETLKLELHQSIQKNEILHCNNEFLKNIPEDFCKYEKILEQEVSNNSSKGIKALSNSELDEERNCFYKNILKKKKDLECSKQDNQRGKAVTANNVLEENETLKLKLKQSRKNDKIQQRNNEIHKKITEDFCRSKEVLVREIFNNSSKESKDIKDFKLEIERNCCYRELIKKEKDLECFKQDNQKLIDQSNALEAKFKSKCEEVHTLINKVNRITQEDVAEVNDDYQKALVGIEALQLKIHQSSQNNEILQFNKEILKPIPEDPCESEQFHLQDILNNSSKESNAISDNTERDFGYKELKMKTYLECFKQGNQREKPVESKCKEVAEVNANYEQALVDIETLKLKLHQASQNKEIPQCNNEVSKTNSEDFGKSEEFLVHETRNNSLNESKEISDYKFSSEWDRCYKELLKKEKDLECYKEDNKKLMNQYNVLEATFKSKCEEVYALINNVKKLLTKEDITEVNDDYQQALVEIETLKSKLHQSSQNNEIPQNSKGLLKNDLEYFSKSEEFLVQEMPSISSKERKAITDSTFNVERDFWIKEFLKKEKVIECFKEDKQILVNQNNVLEEKLISKCDEMAKVSDDYQHALVEIETLKLKLHQSSQMNEILQCNNTIPKTIPEDFCNSDQFLVKYILNSSIESKAISDSKLSIEWDLCYRDLLKKEEDLERSKRDNRKLIYQNNVLKTKLESKCRDLHSLNNKVSLLTQELSEVKDDYQQSVVENETLKLNLRPSRQKNGIPQFNKEIVRKIPDEIFKSEQRLSQDKPKLLKLVKCKLQPRMWNTIDPGRFCVRQTKCTLQKEVDLLVRKDETSLQKHDRLKKYCDTLKRCKSNGIKYPADGMMGYYGTRNN